MKSIEMGEQRQKNSEACFITPDDPWTEAEAKTPTSSAEKNQEEEEEELGWEREGVRTLFFKLF